MKPSQVLSMRECRWERSHLSEYLDREPAGPLSAEEMTRLQGHIAIYEKCASLSDDYRETPMALSQFRHSSDAESTKRLSESLVKLTSADETSN